MKAAVNGHVGIAVTPRARRSSSTPRTSSEPSPRPSPPSSTSVWATITLRPAGRYSTQPSTSPPSRSS